MSISTVIITKNVDKTIEVCIDSVIDFSDEIIIVDDFSEDRTLNILSKYEKVKIFQRKFDTYINQKNYANNIAKYDYIFSIDSDEWCSKELIKYLKTDDLPSILSIIRKNKIGNKFINYGLWGDERKIRLWKNGIYYWGGTNPHESLIFKDKSIEPYETNYILYHQSVENISDLYSKSLKYSKLASHEYSEKSYPYLFIKLLINPLYKLLKSFVIKKGFLDGWYGLAIAIIATIETFYKYLLAIKIKLNK